MEHLNIKTKPNAQFLISVIIDHNNISKNLIAHVMRLFSLNPEMGYNFFRTKDLLQKMKKRKIRTFSVLIPFTCA